MGIFRGTLSSWIFWFGLFSIVVLGAVFYLVLARGAQVSVTQQLLRQQQVIARAEVSNILTFFEKFGNSVAFLAQLNSIERRDAGATVQYLDTFVEQRREAGLIGGVVLTDKNGVVQFNSNVLGTSDLGGSLADRDYFLELKTQGKKGQYFISQPVVSRLGASKGQTIVVVASPVYQNGAFTGVVAASVKLQPLVERFFGSMRISDMTEMYLVDGQGNLLYSNSNLVRDAVGLSISELFSGDQALSDSIKNTLGKAKEGQFQTEKHLVNYSPIIIGTQTWLLIISSPAQEVINLTRPFYVRHLSVFILTALTIFLFGGVVVRKNQF